MTSATAQHASARGAHRDATGELVRLLDDLLVSAHEFLSPVSRDALSDARDRAGEHRLNLVVLGEFKRGKSSLVNALLARDLLPTGVVPLTSVVTTISAGRADALCLQFNDGREEARPLAELAQYVTEAGNPHNGRGVKSAALAVNSDLLGAGLCIVDTPGVGSIHAHNTAAARAFLPRVDAALCVLDVAQPLSETERDLLLELAQRVPSLIVAVNKVDQLTTAELSESVEFIAAAVREAVGDGAELFVVSAREGHGVEELRRRLRRLTETEQAAVVTQSAVALAVGATSEALQTVELETSALMLPVEELAQRMRELGERIVNLRAANREAAELLEHAGRRAARELIEGPLAEHMGRSAPRLRESLREYVAHRGTIAPRQLARDLDLYIDAQVRGEFDSLLATFPAALEGQLSQIQRGYAARVAAVLDSVSGAVAELFGCHGADLLPASGLRESPRFTFKLEDPEHLLDAVVRVGRRRAPGRIGRYLVARAAEERLAALLDRHAGRLRSELVAGAATALRDYQRELDMTVEGAIATIERAAHRASEERQHGVLTVQRRRAALDRTRTRLRELRDAFVTASVRSAVRA